MPTQPKSCDADWLLVVMDVQMTCLAFIIALMIGFMTAQCRQLGGQLAQSILMR